MKTKLVAVTLLAGFLGTGILLASGGSDQSYDCPMGKSQNKMMNERAGCMHGDFKNNKMNHRGYESGNMMGKSQMGHFMMRAISKLDLSKEQEEKFYKLQEKHHEEMFDNKKQKQAMIFESFSDSDFNKEKFIKSADEHHKARITKMASHIEEVYNILNVEQKKELKKIFDAMKVLEGK